MYIAYRVQRAYRVCRLRLLNFLCKYLGFPGDIEGNKRDCFYRNTVYIQLLFCLQYAINE